MFTRSRLGVEPEKQGQILHQVADLLDQNTLKTTMTEVMDWHQVQEAHRKIQSGRTIGKMVMKVK